MPQALAAHCTGPSRVPPSVYPWSPAKSSIPASPWSVFQVFVYQTASTPCGLKYSSGHCLAVGAGSGGNSSFLVRTAPPSGFPGAAHPRLEPGAPPRGYLGSLTLWQLSSQRQERPGPSAASQGSEKSQHRPRCKSGEAPWAKSQSVCGWSQFTARGRVRPSLSPPLCGHHGEF